MNGGSVTLNQGEKLEIKLSSNPTTGYNWEIVQIDSAIVQQVGDVEYKSYSKRIGSGGVNTYTFQAASEGKTHLTLIYHRSFEKDTPPIETFDLDIEVK
jgi:inhibitor of cysteine peptidase